MSGKPPTGGGGVPPACGWEAGPPLEEGRCSPEEGRGSEAFAASEETEAEREPSAAACEGSRGCDELGEGGSAEKGATGDVAPPSRHVASAALGNGVTVAGHGDGRR